MVYCCSVRIWYYCSNVSCMSTILSLHLPLSTFSTQKGTIGKYVELNDSGSQIAVEGGIWIVYSTDSLMQRSFNHLL